MSLLEISSPKKVQGRQCPKGNGGCFLKGHVGRFQCAQTFIKHTGVLGVGAHTTPEDLVPYFESLCILAYGFYLPGQIGPNDGSLGPYEPSEEPREKRVSLSNANVP